MAIASPKETATGCLNGPFSDMYWNKLRLSQHSVIGVTFNGTPGTRPHGPVKPSLDVPGCVLKEMGSVGERGRNRC